MHTDLAVVFKLIREILINNHKNNKRIMKKLLLAIMIALPMSAFAQKFAHINSSAVMQAMPETSALQTEIQNLQKTYEDELKRMQDEIKTKTDEYEKKGATLPDAVKKRQEQEIQDLIQRYQEFGQTSEQELQKTYQTKMAPIQEKVIKAIKEVGDAGDYVYVMDMAAGIPYINDKFSTDITNQVKAKLGIK